MKSFNSRIVATAGGVGLAAALSLSYASAAPITDQAHLDWRAAIHQTPTPHEGCFHAAFPDREWTEIACTTVPNVPFGPRHGAKGRTVGNGNDYAAVVSGTLSEVIGSFPTVTGVTKETGVDGANSYSLQLNSGFMDTAVCNGHSECQSWEQFIYSSDEEAVFMQYWLINYGNSCPGGWQSYSGSCYKNSAATSVPKIAITELDDLKISATAVSGGNDTLVFSTSGDAYTTSGKDTVVDLASGWNQAEWNIVGDGGGSAAKFNKGASVTVKIATTDGSSSAPTCQSDDGTTGETNNLNLGKCTTAGGSSPYAQFIESN